MIQGTILVYSWYHRVCYLNYILFMALDTTKHVFGVSDKARLLSTATS